MIGLEPLEEELDEGVVKGESWLPKISDDFPKKEEEDTFSGKRFLSIVGCCEKRFDVARGKSNQ